MRTCVVVVSFASFVLIAHTASGQVGAGPLQIRVASGDNGTLDWTPPAGDAVEDISLLAVGFSLGPDPIPFDRLALFVRLEADAQNPFFTSPEFAAYRAVIDLAPQSGPLDLSGSSAAGVFDASGFTPAVTHSQLVTALSALADDWQTGLAAQTAPFNPVAYSGYGTPVSSWPTWRNGWEATSSIPGAFWKPAFADSWIDPTYGHQTHIFSPSRLAERALLAQSENQSLAMEFLRSPELLETVNNGLQLAFQAILLPEQPPEPGTALPLVSDRRVSGLHDPDPRRIGGGIRSYYHVVRGGIIMSTGAGGFMMLSVGLSLEVSSVTFVLSGGGEEASTNVVRVSPQSPYILVGVPVASTGEITSIDVDPQLPSLPALQMLPPEPGAKSFLEAVLSMPPDPN